MKFTLSGTHKVQVSSGTMQLQLGCRQFSDGVQWAVMSHNPQFADKAFKKHMKEKGWDYKHYHHTSNRPQGSQWNHLYWPKDSVSFLLFETFCEELSTTLGIAKDTLRQMRAEVDQQQMQTVMGARPFREQMQAVMGPRPFRAQFATADGSLALELYFDPQHSISRMVLTADAQHQTALNAVVQRLQEDKTIAAIAVPLQFGSEPQSASASVYSFSMKNNMPDTLCGLIHSASQKIPDLTMLMEAAYQDMQPKMAKAIQEGIEKQAMPEKPSRQPTIDLKPGVTKTTAEAKGR